MYKDYVSFGAKLKRQFRGSSYKRNTELPTDFSASWITRLLVRLAAVTAEAKFERGDGLVTATTAISQGSAANEAILRTPV